jgi:hypothetical protein
MRHVPRLLVTLVSTALLVVSAAGTAWATSIEDLIKLKTNKVAPVSDDVLIALIESDGSVFHLTADDIVPLRQKGLSERVIIAMMLTAKKAPPEVDVVEPLPLDSLQGPGKAVTQPTVPVVNVTQSNVQTVEQPRQRSETRTAYIPVYVPVAVPVVRQPAPEPVYWGFGGQRRPDTWLPTPDPAKTTPDKKPATPIDPKKSGGGTQ